MGSANDQLAGPDLTVGVAASEVTEGEPLRGHAHGEPVLLFRRDGQVSAVGGACTHYGGPLAEGLVVGDTVRCPWHHACFSLRTGEALGPPALLDLPRWEVAERDGRVNVTGKIDPAPTPQPPARGYAATRPASVLLLGAGPAGHTAAETLRRHGYDGPVVMIDGDPDASVDRPNLSKDFLAGSAPEEWIPLKPPSFYEEHGIRRVLGRRAERIDPGRRRVALDDGSHLEYEALLVATGADPVRLPDSVTGGRRVHYLRTLSDSRALIAAAERSGTAVVLGASFIGLEVAASLRARGLDVHVVAPEQVPLERVLGRDLGEFVRGVHAEHGVAFHLGRTAQGMDERSATLDDGTRLEADLVVAGIGVRPNVALAEAAGLRVDNGIVVDERLRTSAPGIWAAGDVARVPDPRTGGGIRVEHWVVAERQGQAAALSMLGLLDRFEEVPFFWSAHYDVTIAYTGHAERWDTAELNGRPEDRDCSVAYRDGTHVRALATIFRDQESLRFEAALQHEARGVQEVG